MATSHPLILHSWSGPDAWGLPAIDPDTVFVASLLQRTLLGRWTLSESNDPDASPNGQLPYLEHGSRKISSLPSIISYLSTLSPSSTTPTPQPAPRDGDYDQKSTSASLGKGEDIDKDLSKTQKAELVAWKSVIQSELADLTAFTLYSSDKDYDLLFNHLANSLPFPQAHYVPQRLRALHQARLEHVGLWALRATDDPLSSPAGSRWKTQPLGVMSTERVLPPLERASNERKEATAGKFGTQRLLEQSSLTLGLLSNFLGSADYFFDSSKPTTLDLYLFAQLSLILLPPFTQSVIANQIRTTYPNLQAHTLRILSSCFPPESPTVWPHRDASLGRLSAWEHAKRTIEAVPRVGKALFGVTSPRERPADEIEESKKKAAFTRKRWLWFAGVGVTFITYVFASGLVQIGGDEEEEYEVAEGEDE
ncbi:Translocase of outer mitochondrial membrane complex, subunit TOM37/Metaxin 1 [Phaffia rhodozyma]|uniref:Translocase of outer mitochondrial membrane complex, subunit TOM37/Metaxin 1 n=1 Tax=Phaffia rhodozyma TaxID=264483 RepID=A0A0F7SVI3_PHARH|nr:Translocase of outer mitochondrial membrane complex, subunit TOM37/Metaxin 1 [Phaffia rhodozyma]